MYWFDVEQIFRWLSGSRIIKLCFFPITFSLENFKWTKVASNAISLNQIDLNWHLKYESCIRFISQTYSGINICEVISPKLHPGVEINFLTDIFRTKEVSNLYSEISEYCFSFICYHLIDGSVIHTCEVSLFLNCSTLKNSHALQVFIQINFSSGKQLKLFISSK